jgi:hypothetical protein
MDHKIIRSGILLTGVLVGMSFLKTAQAQAPGTFTNLGTINFVGTDLAPTTITNDPGNFNGGEIKWFQFTLASPLTNGSGRFLDIYTTQDPVNTTEGITTTDSEIGLYDNLGNLLTADDDDGASLFSQLTYSSLVANRAYANQQPAGATAPAAFNGRDLTGVAASLPAGTYWLATGRFNVAFNALNWGVTSANTSTTNNSVRLVLGSGVTSAPEPGTMALLALGTAGILARRKRKTA